MRPSDFEMRGVLKIMAQKELARRHFLNFVRGSRPSNTPLKVGYHTRKMADIFQHSLENYKRGISSKIILTVPFRHGKSEFSSRTFPAYVLGHLPDTEVMLVCYSASLAHEFSRDSLNLINSDYYRSLFPNTRIAKTSKAVVRWGIDGHRGKFMPAGLGGSITGKGADVMILDDYLRSRQEAESVLMRDKIWNAFTNDLLTRLAPIHICVIVATRWHEDDLIGRILHEQSVNSNFPHFELVAFPAKDDRYPSGYLFPERFSPEWYENQFSALGTYGASALLQCNPVARGGNLLLIDRVVWHDSLDSFPPNLKTVRFWDLASSAKERMKSDPDYTVGTRAGMVVRDGHPHLYVFDVVRLRAEAPVRNRTLVEVARADGPAVRQGVESVAGYKDTYTMIKDLLAGISKVEKISVSGDKISRTSYLEPLFEAGQVHALRAPWNAMWKDELSAFPFGKHDDQVDSLSGALTMLRQKTSSDFFSI